LFRIAHNRALDVLRRYDRRMGEPLTDDLAALDAVDPDDVLAREEALRAAVSRWHLVPGWLDGREVLALFRGPRETRPASFVELTVVDERIAVIRDFLFVPYVVREAAFEFPSVR
jgi:hypothetical protein